MTEYACDITEIEADGARMSALADALLDIGHLVGVYTDAVGSPAVANALHEFADNWSRHRNEIVDGLRSGVQAAREAAATYRCLESSLTGSFDRIER